MAARAREPLIDNAIVRFTERVQPTAVGEHGVAVLGHVHHHHAVGYLVVPLHLEAGDVLEHTHRRVVEHVTHPESTFSHHGDLVRARVEAPPHLRDLLVGVVAAVFQPHHLESGQGFILYWFHSCLLLLSRWCRGLLPADDDIRHRCGSFVLDLFQPLLHPFEAQGFALHSLLQFRLFQAQHTAQLLGGERLAHQLADLCQAEPQVFERQDAVEHGQLLAGVVAVTAEAVNIHRFE